jgi:hypothetical protein
MDKPNSAKGRDSYDSTSTGEVIAFFNKNITPYATEAGGFKFDLVPVERQKDIMLNVARMHAQQEYDRIMQLVAVLQRQAEQIKRRLEITDAVHSAKYDFQLYHGQIYWLAFDTKKQYTILAHHGPNEWYTGAPEWYQYICRVKWLGDHTWIEVDEEGNNVN